MASTYSSRLRIELIGTGEQSGIWGDTTNTNLGTLIDEAIAGVAAITMSDANYTLTVADGATDQSRKAVLVMAGTLTAARNVICPSSQKVYVVKNSTTGGFAITIKTSAGSGVSVANGSTALVYCDGTNVELAANVFNTANPTLTGNISLDGAVVVNDSGADRDFRVEGDGDANLIFADASTDRVGIGTNTPSVKLDVSGAAAITGAFTVTGDSSLNGAVVINDAGADKDTRIEGDTDTNLVFVDASTDRVGIGTATPGSKLDVLGTLRLSGSVSGYVGLAPASAAGSTTYTLPSADGSNGQALVTNGSGTLSWAAAGISASSANTFTARQTFQGSTSVLALGIENAAELATVSATAATGTINFDITTQAVLYYTTNASGNFTLNFRASSGTTLNTAMNTGDSVTVAFLNTNGGTAYYNSAVQVDGSSVTPKWQGGTAPTSGNASSIDVYVYTIVKTASATFTVAASQTRFA
jgi:hypothetical protein